MKGVANVFSYLGHPIFMPLLACMIIGYNAKEIGLFSYDYPLASIYFFLGINTIFLPLLSVLIMKRYGFVSSLNMDDRKERFFPYLMFTFYLIITLYLFNRLNLGAIFGPAFMGVIIAMILLLVFNQWTKVSAHSIGISGVIGSYLGMADQYHFFSATWFVLFILFAIAITTSRIILEKHTVQQVFYGMLIGVLSCYIAFKYGILLFH